MSDFDDRTRAALDFAGMSLGEGDLEVLRVVAQVAEPGIRALDAVDLCRAPARGRSRSRPAAGQGGEPGELMNHPQDLSLREQARLVANGDLDAAGLLEATLGRIEDRNGPLRAVVATFPEESRAMLDAAPPGPLHGVPVTIKDMFSLPWRGYRNGTRHQLGAAVPSGAFQRLREGGADGSNSVSPNLAQQGNRRRL